MKSNKKEISLRRALIKIAGMILEIVAAFASDKRSKPIYPAMKAEQLYEENVISGSEFSRHIHGD